MSLRRFVPFIAIAVLVCTTGCLSVQAPREINVGSDGAESVDSSRVPRTDSHDDCRYELEKAYRALQRIEHDLARAHDKAAEYKRERDRAEDALERCQDRLERYRGD